MATLQDLARRVNSVSNTSKITKAMEMVAAAKLRKAQQRVESLRPFSDNLIEMAVQVAKGIRAGDPHPLLQDREQIKNVCIVMFSADRGLSGPFNTNVLRRSLALERYWRKEGAEVRWVVIGRKGVGSIRFRGFAIDQTYTGATDAPTFLDAGEVGNFLTKRFADGEYDKVVIVYNHFGSAVSQQVIDADLLPITDQVLRQATAHLHAYHAPDVLEPIKIDIEAENPFGRGKEGETSAFKPDYVFEPESADLLDELLPTYVKQSLFRAMVESAASKHGAQMTAMHNASDNADEIVEHLTLQRNRARQAAITQEILEVVGGADALS